MDLFIYIYFYQLNLACQILVNYNPNLIMVYMYMSRNCNNPLYNILLHQKNLLYFLLRTNRNCIIFQLILFEYSFQHKLEYCLNLHKHNNIRDIYQYLKCYFNYNRGIQLFIFPFLNVNNWLNSSDIIIFTCWFNYQSLCKNLLTFYLFN